MFSIVIPSWNNLAYLKLCIHSIQQHTRVPHEIIVHLNDGSDGSLQWVQQQGLRYTRSEKNVGVCLAVNHLFAQAQFDWVLFLNDDMVVAPGWDQGFVQALHAVDDDLAVFFGTLIEPASSGPQLIQRDFGRSADTFDLAAFQKHCMDEPRKDLDGVASQPTLVHKKWWQMVGGYSIEFSPGMSSDDDLLMKFWMIGCRTFRTIAASRFYHFSCKSTGRIKHNLGGRVFVMKWGITQKEFYRDYFSQVGQPEHASDNNPQHFVRATRLGSLRRAGYGLFQQIPLQDIEAWDAQPAVGQWQSNIPIQDSER